MINAQKLQYLTLARWFDGYAATLDPDDDRILVNKFKVASRLLEAVWNEYAAEHYPTTLEQQQDNE
jgi:hypothetical protein